MAVSLDLAGTLLHPHPSVGRIYAREAAKFGLTCNAAELDTRFASSFRAVDPNLTPREFWAEVVDRTLAEPGLGSTQRALLADACWEAFAQPEAWRMTRGARVTLAQLRFLGLRIGFLTNADDRLVKVARAKGMIEDSDAVMAEARKPQATAYHNMARALDVRLDTLVHVGDDPEEDGRGAIEAGCRSIVISERPTDAAVTRVARLTGLPELIRSWMLGRPSGRPLRRRERNLLANLGGLPEEKGWGSERALKPLDAAVDEAIRRLGIDRPIPEHAISAAWSKLLPPALARRSAPLRILPDGTLLIHCENSVVRSEATFHTRSLLGKVRELTGCGHIRAIAFSLKG
jgi:HAD superfamily hydrolase (TIGR01549 family)